ARSDSRKFILAFGIFLGESNTVSVRCLFFLDDPAVNGLGDGFPFDSHGTFWSYAGGIRTHN
ncbi:unnamed protein product, partial [Musa textilis]